MIRGLAKLSGVNFIGNSRELNERSFPSALGFERSVRTFGNDNDGAVTVIATSVRYCLGTQTVAFRFPPIFN